MTDNLSFLQFSLQERALHQLAKACWGNYSTCSRSFGIYDKEEFLYEETSKLIDYRKTVVSTIPRKFPLLPKIFKDRLVAAIVLMQKGYSEALVCTNTYRKEIRLMTVFPMSLGPYAAKNFIDPSGRFDEINWVKRFVSDESQSVYIRFDVACFYCFEEVIKELWVNMECIGRSHYETFTDVENKYGYMTAMWSHRLQNKFDYPSNFYHEGFIEAIERGFEYAARFFWDLCSVKEKEKLMNEIEEFNMTCNGIFSDASQFKHEGFALFYYSLLSLEQKRNLISLTSPFGAHFLWTRLVTSRSYEIVLKDIQTIPFPRFSMTYAYVLNELTLKMVELPIPVYEEIFKVLWEPLSQTEVRYILGLGLNIIRNLTEINSMDLLKIVIEPLDRTEKEWMLVNDWQSAGISALCRFMVVGNYDGLCRYLLLLLTDYDRVSMKMMVRTDSIYDFNSFIKVYTHFLARKGWIIPEYVKNEINMVLCSIQENLFEQVYQVNSYQTISY